MNNILVIGPSWVGDMVMAQSLFIALNQRYTDCHIDVLAPEWSLPILKRMPEVRNGIKMPIGHGELALGKRFELGKKLSHSVYNQAIILPNSLKSALIPMFANIPVRTGWRGEMRYGLLNDIRLLIKRDYPLMVQRFVALAYDSEPGAHRDKLLAKNLPRPKLHVNKDQIKPLYQRFNLQKNTPLLALCPGAEFGPAKRWPEQHYGEVATNFINRGWQVALFGSNNDREVCNTIEQYLLPADRELCTNLAGQTMLSEAIDLLSQAEGVVSNDSGLMHIVAALARPMVVVYGSTSAEFTPPLSDNIAIAQLEVECRPCFKRECPLKENKGRLKCLTQLKADTVVRALDCLL